MKHPQIIGYISDHIEELLSLAFSEENSELSQEAFNISYHLQNNLIQKILSSSDFQSTASEVLNRKSPSTSSLSRVCSLATVSINMCMDYFPSTCGFILQLIRYINEPCILQFFSEILADDMTYHATQHWLYENGFPELILNKIRTLNIDANSDPYIDKKSQKLRNIFTTITMCKNSKELIRSLRSYESIQLFLNLPRYHSHLEDEKLMALSAIYSKKHIEDLRDFYPLMLWNISEPYTICNKFRVLSFQVLTKMLLKDKEVANLIEKSLVHQIILRTVFQFYENTFIMKAILDFLEAIFKTPKLNIVFAHSIIEPLIFEGTKSDFLMMNAFTYQVIEKSLVVAAADKAFKASLIDLDGFLEFVSFDLKKRRKQEQDDYGGKRPLVW